MGNPPGEEENTAHGPMMKLTKDDLFSAPPIEGAIPPSEESLRPLLEDAEQSASACFSLGNVLAREGRSAEAVELFTRALQALPESAELHTNLGVALWLADRPDEALSHLRQASLLRSDLVLPHLHSGRLLRERGDRAASISAYEKVTKLDPTLAEPFAALGEMAEEDGDDVRAQVLFREAYARDPALSAVKHRLVLQDFRRGKLLLEEGDLEGALRVWSESHTQFKSGFLTDRVVGHELEEVVRNFRREGGTVAALEQLKKDFAAGKQGTELYYPLFLRLFFAIGLMPDCYEKVDELEQERERWRLSLAVKGEHPFPHFRMGILDCYEGRLENARDELRLCMDRLLPKKRASLRLTQLLEQLEDVENALREARGERISSPEAEWEEHGFDNPFQLQAWRKSGLTPSAAARWRDASFTPTQAANWSTQIESPEVARLWLDAGFTDAKVARQWHRGGFDPVLASEWAPHYGDRVDQAVQAFKAGFSDPLEALRWGEHFLFPWDAVKWRERGFSIDEAVQWIARGIYDPMRAFVTRRDEAIAAEEEFPENPDFIDPVPKNDDGEP